MTVDLDLPPPDNEPTGVAADPVPLPMEPPQPVFGAFKASLAFVLLVVAQMVIGIVVVIGATIVAAAQGRPVANPAFAKSLVNEITVPLLLSGAGVSWLVVFVIARGWAWPVVRDSGAGGAGMRPAGWSPILSWCGAGALASAGYVFVASQIVPFDPNTPLGPLAAAASRGGMDRVAWAVLALAFAPVVEEFFFRGILFAGFARSWGPSAGAVVVTCLFVLLHLFETFKYWPATVAITCLAVGTLAARRLTQSIIPAIAFHWGYNLVIVVTVFVSAWLRR